MKMPDFSGTRVLVLGDVMLDQYYSGRVSRISPEAPVPVVKVEECFFAPGGAANVAFNIKSLGAVPCLIGTAGRDQNGKTLSSILKKKGVPHSFISTDSPTITKMRVIGEHQQIVRLDFEGSGAQPLNFLEQAAQLIEKNIGGAGSLIISDYAKGFCTEGLCRSAIDLTHRFNRHAVIDPKGNDWDKYSGAFIVSPNLKELREICSAEIRNEDSEIEDFARGILKKYSIENLLVTRSEKGMSLIMKKGSFHIQTEAREVFDVSGAGDTVIATLALGIAAGMDLQAAVRLSNKAAGIVVGKFGTAPIEKDELISSFGENEEGKIVSRERIAAASRALKKEGKTVVFTNGCFDIIHRGHIEYLRKAKDMGDILIVGLNTDSSVRGNKGPGRPVNNENDRAEVLSALEFVDYIVMFGEKTPLDLIRAVKPDILVKGGDYRPEDIVGRNYAGKTVTVPFLEGYSTTETIKKWERNK